MTPRPVHGLAFALVLTTIVACASTTSRTTTSWATEAAPAPATVRYELDAIRVDDGTTYQGTLEVRGDRAILVVDERRGEQRAERELGGTIERGDVTYLAFAERGVPAGELECADDGHGLTCTPKHDRIFAGSVPQLRFERLSLHVQSY